MLLHCCQKPVTQEPIATLADLQRYCVQMGESLMVTECCQAVFKGQCLREY